MGQYLSGDNSNEMSAPEDVPFDNGYVLDQYYIPMEVLALILSYVDKGSLSHRCKYVCKVWYDIIKDDVWKIKAEREYLNKMNNTKPHNRLPSIVYKNIVWKNTFNKNILKNHTGLEKFKYWHLVVDARNQWTVEKPPLGVKLANDREAEGPKVAFVTSYLRSTKKQLINLEKVGFDSLVLDHYQPHIVVSEWYAARWDCGSTYELSVRLLDEKKETLHNFEYQKDMDNWRNGWEEVTHTFKAYGAGVRYILFSHSGKDKRYWAGHYGSKMADASVQITFASGD